MNSYVALQALSSGLNFLEGLTASEDSVRALNLGTLATTTLKLREVYFGETNATRKQAQARELGRHHSLEALRVIESFVSQLDDKKTPGSFASHSSNSPPNSFPAAAASCSPSTTPLSPASTA